MWTAVTSRVLRHRGTVVALGVVLSLAAGVLVTHRVSIAPPQIHPRETESGLAHVQVLVDTPRSLVAAARTVGDDTIATRAALLGNLLETDDLRTEIARRADLRPSELAVVNPYFGAPAVATPLSRDAVEVAQPAERNIVTVSTSHRNVPIVSILATADTLAVAARLADAASAALGSLASRPETTGGRFVSIEPLGPAEVEPVAEPPSAVKGVVAALLAFGLWCAALFLLGRIVGPRSSTPAPASDHPGWTRRIAPPASSARPGSLNGGVPRRVGPPRR